MGPIYDSKFLVRHVLSSFYAKTYVDLDHVLRKITSITHLLYYLLLATIDLYKEVESHLMFSLLLS